MKIIIKFLIFFFLLFFISFYFSFSGYEHSYGIILNNWEKYNLYHWSILWHFWLFPFNILDYSGDIIKWENDFAPFIDIFSFSFNKVIFIFLNIIIYFIIFCFIFKKELEKFFCSKKIFSLNDYFDKIWKVIVLITIYIIIINFMVIIVWDILFI